MCITAILDLRQSLSIVHVQHCNLPIGQIVYITRLQAKSKAAVVSTERAQQPQQQLATGSAVILEAATAPDPALHHVEMWTLHLGFHNIMWFRPKMRKQSSVEKGLTT